MPFRFTSIDDPAATRTFPNAINSDGTEIVGNANSAQGYYEINGTFTLLPSFMGQTVSANGVNDLGQIVGSIGPLRQSVLWSGGVYTEIDDPNAGFVGTVAHGINDAGQIVGSYVDTGGHQHGFLDTNGHFTDIDVPGSSATEAYGINSAGVIVGQYRDSAGGLNGFIDVNGTFTTLPLLFFGINDHNQAVGYYYPAGQRQAFVYSNKVVTAIDDPALSISYASGITNSGQIVGYGYDSSNAEHSFITNPLLLAADDYTGDNRSDLLWRQVSGALSIWQMNGATAASTAPVTFNGNVVTPDSSWSVAGIGDFSFDGTADVLWRQSGGGLDLWQMNGATIASTTHVSYQGQALTPDESWTVAGASDFTGDGMTDVLWRQAGGGLSIWQMDGATITNSTTVTYQGNVVTPDASWSVAGTGDFSGDDKADVMWRQSSGALSLWQMNGASISQSNSATYNGSTVTPDSSWSVAGVGDFDGDGHADLLWQQSSSGSVMEWLMNGNTITSAAAPTFQGSPVTVGSSWSLIEIGDFNNDGNTDMLWRQNTTGTLSEWLMNGTTITASNTVASVPDQSWQVQSQPRSFI